MTAADLKRHYSLERYFRSRGSTPDPGGRWRCLLPDRHQHGDAHHSVTITDGRARCWSQTCFGDKGADLFAAVGIVEGLSTFAEQRRRILELAGLATDNGNPSRQRHRLPILRHYEWTDQEGRTAWKLRRDTPRQEERFIWAKDPDGRQLGKGALTPTLYRLPQVRRADSVINTEGERDADTLNGLLNTLGMTPAIVATCTPNGAGDVKGAYLTSLHGKACVYLSGDNDEAGRGYREHCAQLLSGKVGTLRRLDVPSGVKDWTEWVEGGGTAAQFAEQLHTAEPWTASAGPEMAAADPKPDGCDRGLVKELADEIRKTVAFAQDAGGLLCVFEGGVYRPTGEPVVARRVKAILEATGDTKRWSSHRAREVAEYLRVDAPALWDTPPLDVLNLRNGLLDLNTRTLRPHDPTHLSPIQLPVAYDPAATCPRWERFVNEVFPEDCRVLAYEIIATLMRPDTAEQRAILAIGEGGNGKSTYLTGVTAFLGRENVAGLSLHRLDKFAVARLLGKLANICPDLPSEHLVSTSAFKAIVGGDRLTAERKFQSSFEFGCFARLVFSANHYPQSKDGSHAFFRRWLVIPFERTFDPRDQTPRPVLDAQLADPTELSGVLNRTLEALATMTARGGRYAETETLRALARIPGTNRPGGGLARRPDRPGTGRPGEPEGPDHLLQRACGRSGPGS